MQLIDETWKPVIGYEKWYEVSNLGRVRSLRVRNKHVDRPRTTPLILKFNITSTGYLAVSLRGDCPKHPSVHALVARAFIGPCPKGLEIDHINRDRKDNRVSNLRYVSRFDNHANTEGASKPKLSKNDVRFIRCFLKLGCTNRQISMFYDINERTISKIKHSRRYVSA